MDRACAFNRRYGMYGGVYVILHELNAECLSELRNISVICFFVFSTYLYATI